MIFFLFLTLYVVTAQRSVGWQDSGEFQYRICAGDYHWYSGIARAHPLYILMARIFTDFFPRTLFFYASNLFSGVGMACAVTLLAACVWRLTQSARAAVLAAVVLGTAHMAWWMSAVAEVYTWSLACLLSELYGVIRWHQDGKTGWLVFVLGVNGVHLGIHNFALLGLPVYAGLLGWESVRMGRWRLLAAGITLWCVGGSLIGWQALQVWWSGESWTGTLCSVLFGSGYKRQVLGIGGFQIKRWLMNVSLAGLSLLNPCWLFVVGGIKRLREKDCRLLVLWGALIVLYGAFWIRYFVPDQATFVLPVLGLLAVMVGIGYWKLETEKTTFCWERWAVMLVLGAGIATVGPWGGEQAAQTARWMPRGARVLPFRNEIKYWLIPWKQNERSAEQFVVAVHKQMKAGDILIADSTSASPLMAALVNGIGGKDWRLVTPWARLTADEWTLAFKTRCMYLVSPVPGYAPADLLSGNFTFEREGVLWRIKKKE